MNGIDRHNFTGIKVTSSYIYLLVVVVVLVSTSYWRVDFLNDIIKQL